VVPRAPHKVRQALFAGGLPGAAKFPNIACRKKLKAILYFTLEINYKILILNDIYIYFRRFPMLHFANSKNQS